MAQGAPQFKIENNVLIGREVPMQEKCPNVGELLLKKLKTKPDFVAEVEAATGKQNTFRDMTEQSVKCAIWLKRQGVQPGDVVGICVDNNISTSVPIFATLYVAGVISGWDHQLSVKSARYFLSLISPKIVFVNEVSVDNLAQAAKEENLDIKIVVIEQREGYESLEDILESVDSAEIDGFQCTPITSPNDVAMICWSSGSTGLPKGSELSHRSVLNSATPIEDVNIVDQVAMWTPTIRWHVGLTLMIESVLSNAKKVIIPDIDDDEGFINYIEKYGVTYFTCDPCVPIRWYKSGLIGENSVPTLKKFVLSGAHFKADNQQAVRKAMPNSQILQCYGLTDAGGLCISQSRNSKAGSLGFVCKGLQMKIVDTKTGESLGPNETGEMWIKSPFLMNGYYKNSEATKNIIDADGWLHTSDFGYYDEDGEIFMVDRISEFINYRSINLSPAEIESVLESHPCVLKAAVVPLPHETDEEHPLAFVMKVPGKEVTEEELKKLVENTLPWYCHLHDGIKFMDDFPRTSTGKIAKKELKELAKSFVTKKSSS